MESLKKVVLTFDDGMKSNFDFTSRVLKDRGQTATFFISRNRNLWKDTELAEPLISEEELQQMNEEGFELGNHTFHHMMIQGVPFRKVDIEFSKMEKFFKNLGIPKAQSVAYPSYGHNHFSMKCMSLLEYKFARAGYKPNEECEYNSDTNLNTKPWDRKEVSYYWPGKTNPMQVFCTGILNGNDHNPCYTADLFIKDIEETPKGSIPVFSGHGMPTKVRRDNFDKISKYLADNGWETIHMKDL